MHDQTGWFIGVHDLKIRDFLWRLFSGWEHLRTIVTMFHSYLWRRLDQSGRNVEQSLLLQIHAKNPRSSKSHFSSDPQPNKNWRVKRTFLDLMSIGSLLGSPVKKSWLVGAWTYQAERVHLRFFFLRQVEKCRPKLAPCWQSETSRDGRIGPGS